LATFHQKEPEELRRGEIEIQFQLGFYSSFPLLSKDSAPVVAMPPFNGARGCLISTPAVITKQLRLPANLNPAHTPHKSFKLSNIQ
jgi:hypothetical protein